MMTLNRDAVPQIPIPGIDPTEYRMRALMEKFPIPNDRKTAELFLRAKCIVNIKYLPDADKYRVGLKTTNYDEDNFKCELGSDLPIYDRVAYDEKYVEMAQELYWLYMSKEKDKQPGEPPKPIS